MPIPNSRSQCSGKNGPCRGGLALFVSGLAFYGRHTLCLFYKKNRNDWNYRVSSRDVAATTLHHHVVLSVSSGVFDH